MTLPTISGKSPFEIGRIEKDLKFPFERLDAFLSEKFLSKKGSYPIVFVEFLLSFFKTLIHGDDSVQDLYINSVKNSLAFEQDGSSKALNLMVAQKETHPSSPQVPIEVELGTEQAMELSEGIDRSSLHSPLSEDSLSDPLLSILDSCAIHPILSSGPIPPKGLSSQDERLPLSVMKPLRNILDFYAQSLSWEKEDWKEPVPPKELMIKVISPIDHLNSNSENPVQCFIDKEALISQKGLVDLSQERDVNFKEFILKGNPPEPLFPNQTKIFLQPTIEEVSMGIEISNCDQKASPLTEEVIEVNSLGEVNPFPPKKGFIPSKEEEILPSFKLERGTIASEDSEIIGLLREGGVFFEENGDSSSLNMKEHKPKEFLFNHSIGSPKPIPSPFKEIENPPHPLPFKMDPFEIYQQISKQIIWSLKNNGERIQMVLDPPQLGSLLLEIDREKGNLRTTIWAENIVTKEILEHHQIQLEKILRGEGFKLEKFEVLLQQDMGTLHHRDDTFGDRRQPQEGHKGESLYSPLSSIDTLSTERILFPQGSQYVDLFV